ncbi:LUD domain-containing protein [Acrocarpospora sp. B8E8]|uniref:LUD domain-containing protein n=1 Tax=Acrocarpospora sp. B8E8 TaxID=3153572 RepID=UPI00325D5E81
MTKSNQVMEAPPLDEAFAVPAAEDQLERAAKGLRERGYAVHVVDGPEDARALVSTLVPADKEVFTASSETLRTAGIAADLDESGRFRSVRAQLAELDIAAQIRMGATPDVVVGSVHAVTEDGIMVAASASGSQLASYAAGARQAIWVVGAQKVVTDLDTALRRIRTYSLPREWVRIQEVYGQPSFLGKILIFEREMPDRGTAILIRSEIGF